jgi:hypothetical protein
MDTQTDESTLLENSDAVLAPIQVYRFSDLKSAGLCRDWSGLKYLITHMQFPEGFRLGARSRAWLASDVIEWLRSRPKYAGPARLLGIARQNAERVAARRRGVSA